MIAPVPNSSYDGGDRPFISVVIATHEFDAELDQCMASILATPYPHMEVIVVDDARSRDPGRTLGPGVRLIRNDRSKGPAGARNAGAAQARGEIIFFVDSDCEIAPDALERVATVLGDGGPDAMFGIESGDMKHANFASQYRNLWMRYALMGLPADPGHIHTSCAAIKTPVFRRLGGFDERYGVMEDSDLGHRLANQAGRTLRDEHLVFTHHRHYDLLTLLETERVRASAVVAWHLRKLFTEEQGAPVAFTVPRTHAAGLLTFGVALAVAVLGAALRAPGVAAIAALGIGLAVALRGDFLLYLKRQRGWSFFAKSALFTIPDYLWVLAGATIAVLRFRRTSWIAAP